MEKNNLVFIFMIHIPPKPAHMNVFSYLILCVFKKNTFDKKSVCEAV